MTQKKVTLGDMDLIGDEFTHAGCQGCYPIETMRTYDPYISVCGVATYVHPSVPGEDEYAIPSNACPACLKIFQTNDSCPKCGYTTKGDQ